MQRTRDILRRVNAVSLGVAALLLLAMTFMLCLNLLSRDFLGNSFVGVDALSAYFMVWITFIGSAAIVPDHGHVTIDILLRAAGERVRRAIYLVTGIIGSLGSLYVAVFGLKIAISIFDIGVEEPTLSISKGYLFLIPAIACLLMFINYLVVVYDTFRGPTPSISNQTDR